MRTSSTRRPRSPPLQQQQPPPPPQSLADKHHAAGVAHRKRGNVAAALAEYTAAIQLDPHHFKARPRVLFSTVRTF